MYTQRVHGVSVYMAPIRRCLQLGDMTTRVVDDGFRLGSGHPFALTGDFRLGENSFDEADMTIHR